MVTYDTSQPPTPTAPALNPASQTGGNNPPTTSVRNPSFNVNLTVNGTKVDSSLALLRDGLVVAQGPYDVVTGNYQITDPGPVPDGTHVYQLFLTDRAGNKQRDRRRLQRDDRARRPAGAGPRPVVGFGDPARQHHQGHRQPEVQRRRHRGEFDLDPLSRHGR